MRIPVLFESAHAMAERQVLIDSGATDNFISKNLINQLKISTLPVAKPIKIWNVDGTHNQDGEITQFTDLEVTTGNQTKTLRFLITHLGSDEVILGLVLPQLGSARLGSARHGSTKTGRAEPSHSQISQLEPS